MLFPRNQAQLFFFLFLLLYTFISLSAYGQTNLDKALQLTPNIEAGKKRFVLCAACHGQNGQGEQAGEFPSIAGQHQTVMIKQILDIQSKKRFNPTMYPFVDSQTLGNLQGLVDVVAYTASLEAGNEQIKGNGKQLDKGAMLYAQNCSACHGQQAQGSNELLYPRVNKQHFPYLVRELNWIRDKVRKNADPTMVTLLQSFSDDDIQAVADYLSRL